jgi:tRNA (guanosine-2'-O-)-methyltransferase
MEATDRRELAKQLSQKAHKWPRTERRQQRVLTVLRHRQPDLTVVLENVHDPHNVAAVLRSCDAVGVLRVHVVYTVEEPPREPFARTTSASAAKWVDVIRHESIAACYTALRAEGFTILATSLAPGSRDLYAMDLRQPVALVFGNEHRGVSEEAVALADDLVVIPMYGMVQSLNISVACAVMLFEAMRQRRAAGDYDRPKLSDEMLQRLADDWLRR